MNSDRGNTSNRRKLIWLIVLPIAILALLSVMGIYYVTGMSGGSYSGARPPLTEDEAEIRDRLRDHLEVLAGDIGERNTLNYKQLQESANYIENTLEGFGYEVSSQEFTADGKSVRNIEVEITGASLPQEIVVIGAHYDSARGTPGADDNGTGTVAVLELARLLKGRSMTRTVRLVLFPNEELPFFGTEYMGSLVYARRSQERGEKVVGMLSLEMLGYYSDEDGSQNYPSPFSYFYPSTGNFVAFVGNLSSRPLVRKCVGSFRRHTKFPSEGAAAPGRITGVGWSDHWAFWEQGYQAVMVTDTAFFRNMYYHTPEDTPDKIDYEGMARVVSGLRHVVADLADME
jgi:Zn-dependent M28 family amino/carboxypeptidase